MKMPVSDRRYQIHLLKNEHKAKEEHYAEEAAKIRNGSSGKQVRRISGDELKAKLQNGEIENML